MVVQRLSTAPIALLHSELLDHPVEAARIDFATRTRDQTCDVIRPDVLPRTYNQTHGTAFYRYLSIRFIQGDFGPLIFSVFLFCILSFSERFCFPYFGGI
jgi:hypothetical protein